MKYSYQCYQLPFAVRCAAPDGTHPSLCNYAQAASPQSSSSSLSDGAAHFLASSPQSGINMTNGVRNGASSPNAHTANPSLNSLLPHKLRHKHARSAPNDSDTERGEKEVNVAAEAVSSDLPSEEAKPDVTVRPPVNLKEENFTLRQELRRLATEVNALKHYLTPLNAYGAAETPSSARDNGGKECDEEEVRDDGATSPEPTECDAQSADRVSTASCSSESGFSSEDAGSQREND